MLLTEARFKTFTPKQICDATKSTEVLVTLSRESRAEVDEMVRKPVAAGGSTCNEPQVYDFMYGHGFHVWTRISASGWPHLGTRLHETRRNGPGSGGNDTMSRSAVAAGATAAFFCDPLNANLVSATAHIPIGICGMPHPIVGAYSGSER